MDKKPPLKDFKKMCEAKLGNREAIAKGFGVTRKTIYNWITNNKDYEEVFDQVQESNKDFGESQLRKLMEGYQEEDVKIFQYNGEPVMVPYTKKILPDTAAIIFYNKTKNRDRGYGESLDVTTKDNPIRGFDIIPASQLQKEDPSK